MKSTTKFISLLFIPILSLSSCGGNNNDNKENNINQNITYYDVYNQDCENLYDLVVYEEDSYLQYKEDKTVIESYKNVDNPYLKGNYSILIYVDDPNYSQYKHIAIIDEKLYDLDKNEYIDVKDTGGLFNGFRETNRPIILSSL